MRSFRDHLASQRVIVPAGVITLTASITPGQKRITLSDTSLLAAGMMIEIVSNQLWYYDSRGIDTCGELHEIARIVSSTQIEVWDFTRDLYDIATDTITIRAYSGHSASRQMLAFDPSVSARRPAVTRCGRK
ncbi:hypothetical protein [Neorhizobium sp. R1-B]|uniref:hypothetical protein n=1 Tax=Neorhizobium sp. R1-B TaxID=2485162 RepID=UPI0010659944|nr:hypothetical protein [Neorhizobium sp. R1-B]